MDEIVRACRADTRFALDSPLEEGIRSEPRSLTPNSLLAGKIQGILFVQAPAGDKSPRLANDLEPNSLRIGTGNYFGPS